VLYRITPPNPVTWCDITHRTIGLAKQHPEADLDRLDWLPAERPLSDDFLRLAVRYGVATTTGIAVAAIDLAELGRAAEMRQLQVDGDQARAELYATPVMQELDRMFPGTIQTGAALDVKVRASMERAAEDSDRKLAEALEAPAQQELVDHWRRLGGHCAA